MRYLYLLCILLLFACKDNKHFELYPSDHFYLQRAYPYGEIDHKAYSSAVRWKSKMTASSQYKNQASWHQKGPFNLDGRITDIEVHPQDDQILYAGSASGGVYYSEDGGDHWIPVFDDASSLSIGDIALCQSNPEKLYVGTGESNAGGGSIAYDGTGVYKSTDGGESWLNIGLNQVGSIGKLVIDPNNEDIVFVAAMGHLFNNNPERGVFRSQNGGLDWEQVLFVSDSTGAIDMAIHPNDGNIIYAAMWERIRRPHFRQYGGLTSGIYKSTDGGDTWTELTNGLPQNASGKGRIGLAISESDPNVLFSFYAQTDGRIEGIFKSIDGGDTWTEMNTGAINDVPYMWWFGRIYIHPSIPDRLYATSLNMFGSTDGSESWSMIFPGVHVDHHAIGFSRQNPDLIYNGNDGGVYSSGKNGIQNIEYLNGMANFQFYTCAIDPNDSQLLYGGAQDNGIVKSNAGSPDWELIQGGDGFRILIDPEDSQRMYYETQNGLIFRSDNGGVSSKIISFGIQGRANWNTPMELDPTDASIIYSGTQTMQRSIDAGETWEVISPRLVNDNNPPGNISYGTLTYIEVSAHNPQHIYIGTDDGNVWRSLDNGETYENISESLPDRWITSIAVDPWSESGVYLTISGFRFGDSDSQVFYSDDYGSTWLDIGSNLPDVPVNDIICDDLLESSLYLATDIGVFITNDRGLTWRLLGSELPNTVISDLDYHSDDRILVAASYGRGMYTFNLEEPTSSIQLDQSLVSIQPNPANHEIFIESNAENVSFELFDLGGSKLLSSQGNHVEIPENVKSGTYLLRIYENETFHVFRCIIIK